MESFVLNFGPFPILLRLLNGTIKEYSIYSLIDALFDYFSRP
jgi:hypothetical protein